MATQITLRQAISAYIDEAHAERLSPHTIADYRNSFAHLARIVPLDAPISSVTPGEIIRLLSSLADPDRPRRIGPKQALNIHTGLSALWTWAVRRGYAERNVVRDVRRPKPDHPAIIPLSQTDILAMLAIADKRPGEVAGKRTGRLRAILLLLLDTGIRASELCDLRIADVDLRNRMVTVIGKGSKQRSLPVGPSTARALSRYLLAARDGMPPNAALFATADGVPLTRDRLLRLVHTLGEAAHVSGVHPHRFRHTFAIQYLRNGGNTRALQEALGHETLEMIRTYTRIAEADLAAAHRSASPVENWRL